MGRTIHYNVLLNIPDAGANATGRFQDTDPNALLDDNSKVWAVFNTSDPSHEHWDPLPALVGGRADSASLQQGDNIFIAFGEKFLQTGGAAKVQSLQVAVTFGRALSRGAAQVNASPFGPNNNPTSLFLAQFTAPTETHNYQDNDPQQTKYTVNWYVLNLGTITDPARRNHNPYTFIVGALATTATANYSFSHDPEVDVGTDQSLEQPVYAAGV